MRSFQKPRVTYKDINLMLEQQHVTGRIAWRFEEQRLHLSSSVALFLFVSQQINSVPISSSKLSVVAETKILTGNLDMRKHYTCMYVCMHACMHVCMYGWMYGRMYACMHVCKSCTSCTSCMYVCMYVCMHVCMYVCMKVMYVMYVCMYVCM